MKKLLALILLSACTTTDVSGPDAPGGGVSWVVYTHATCNGEMSNVAHSLCVAPSSRDALQPGDAAVNDYIAEWQADCIATQGLLGTEAEGHECLMPDSLTPAAFACAATMVSNNQACP
jgi:hypothetical protein